MHAYMHAFRRCLKSARRWGVRRKRIGKRCWLLHAFHSTAVDRSGGPAALAGNEDLACKALGLTCGNYKYCTKSTTQAGIWECADKASSEQLAVFLTNGSTSDTPSWIWAVVVLSTIVLILISGGTLCAFPLIIPFTSSRHHPFSFLLPLGGIQIAASACDTIA